MIHTALQEYQLIQRNLFEQKQQLSTSLTSEDFYSPYRVQQNHFWSCAGYMSENIINYKKKFINHYYGENYNHWSNYSLES